MFSPHFLLIKPIGYVNIIFMKTKLEKLPKSRIKMHVELDQEEMAKYVEQAYQELAPTVTIKGFRPGKAPRDMIERHLGDERIKHVALDKALPESFAQGLMEVGHVSVGSPAVSIHKFDDGLHYEAEVDVMPKIEVGDYKKLKVKLPEKESVSEEEADKVVDYLRRQKATLKDIDRAAKKEDWLDIDFEGKLNGVVQEKLTSKNFPLVLGSANFIAGFEDELVGMKEGETKAFKLKLANDFGEKELAGKEVEFSVKVNKVKEIILPEADDAFAKDFGQDSKDKMRESIKKSIEVEKDERREQQIEQLMLDKVLGVTKVDVPESLVEQELDRIFHRMEHEASHYGMSLEQYLLQMKKTQEELRKEFRGQAEKNVKIGLMLGEVVKREEMDKEDKEVAKKVVDKLREYLTK